MSAFDKIKFFLMATLVVVSFFITRFFGITSLLGVFAYWTVMSLVLFLIFYTTESSKQLKVFAHDSYEEFLMIVWPEKNDIIRMTIVVAIAVFLVSFVIWGIDLSFSWFVKQLTKKY